MTKPFSARAGDIEDSDLPCFDSDIPREIHRKAAVRLYTLEEGAVYRTLNGILRQPGRPGLEPWCAYLQLLVEGLLLECPVSKDVCWRGVEGNVAARYSVGSTLIWWAFSSMSRRVSCVKDFLGVRDRTLFMVEHFSGRDISMFSRYENESETLLCPGTTFVVVDIMEQRMGAECTQWTVHLREVEPRAPLIKSPVKGLSVHHRVAVGGGAGEGGGGGGGGSDGSGEAGALESDGPGADSRRRWQAAERLYISARLHDVEAVHDLRRLALENVRRLQRDPEGNLVIPVGDAALTSFRDTVALVVYGLRAEIEGHTYTKEWDPHFKDILSDQDLRMIGRILLEWTRPWVDGGPGAGAPVLPAVESTAQLLAKGVAVDLDEAQAARWWRVAADKGNAEAQNKLGLCYASGKGLQQDMLEAVRWYRMAVGHGHAEAQYNLGMCYAHGTGVEGNRPHSMRLWRKAAEQGHPQSRIVVLLFRERSDFI